MIETAREIPFDELTPSVAIDPTWVVAGRLEERSRVLYESPDSRFIVLVWESRTPVELDVRNYPCDEFMTIIEGEVELSDEEGASKRLSAGDSFFIKKGHNGFWRQAGRLRKYAVCYLG